MIRDYRLVCPECFFDFEEKFIRPDRVRRLRGIVIYSETAAVRGSSVSKFNINAYIIPLKDRFERYFERCDALFLCNNRI
jgi:hypothetical protein